MLINDARSSKLLTSGQGVFWLSLAVLPLVTVAAQSFMSTTYSNMSHKTHTHPSRSQST